MIFDGVKKYCFYRNYSYVVCKNNNHIYSGNKW